MFDQLETIFHRPKPFEFYTADELWTDEHTSAQMLAYHLNEEVDFSSRSGAFIDRSVRKTPLQPPHPLIALVRSESVSPDVRLCG